MGQKMYAYVGNWHFKPGDRGISVYEYHEADGSLTLIETVMPHLLAGQIMLHPDKPVLYAVDEKSDLDGKLGGGGSVLAFSVDTQSGRLTFMNRIPTLCSQPCYVSADHSGKYLMVSHHADPHYVTKVVRHPDGTWGNQVITEDAALILAALNDDGSLGQIRDVFLTKSNGGMVRESLREKNPVSGREKLIRVLSVQHCAVPSPDGKIYIVCDAGMDRVYSFGIDEKNGELIRKDVFEEERGVSPRYCAFHPSKEIFYTDQEGETGIHVFSYDADSGRMRLLQKAPVLLTDFRNAAGVIPQNAGAQDLVIHPDGSVVYCSLEGDGNVISVLRVNEDGTLRAVQNISCGGMMPRALCISPDGRFLLCGNMISGNITIFSIGDDGTLTDTGRSYEAVSPSAIRILTVQSEA